MKKKILPILLVGAMLTPIFASCSAPKSHVRTFTQAFSTATTVVLYYGGGTGTNKKTAESTAKAIEEAAVNLDKTLSVSQKESDVSRFNRAKKGEEVEVSALTYSVFTECLTLYEKTDGYFDPSVYPLVDLWGFSPRIRNQGVGYAPKEEYDRADYLTELPKAEHISALSTLVGFSDIVAKQEGEKYYLVKPDKGVYIGETEYTVQVDFGGFLKGYLAREAKDIAKANGFTYGYVSVGGSSSTILEFTGKNADFGVDNAYAVTCLYPEQERARAGEWYLKTYAKNEGVSTSGDYERSYEVGGITYSHAVDPFTGRPKDNRTAAVTVLGGDEAENDAISTALLVMPTATAIEKIKTLNKRVVLTVRAGDKFISYTNVPENKRALSANYAGEFTVKGVDEYV